MAKHAALSPTPERENLFPKLFCAKRKAPRQYGVHDQPDCDVSIQIVTAVEIEKDL